MKTKFGEIKEGRLYLNFEEVGEEPHRWDLGGLEEVIKSLKVKELHFPQGLEHNSGKSELVRHMLPLVLLMGGNYNFRVFTDKSYYDRAKAYYRYGLRGSLEDGYYWTNPCCEPKDSLFKRQ
jgi:hypothetical protein